jgi:hypothetical protein
MPRPDTGNATPDSSRLWTWGRGAGADESERMQHFIATYGYAAVFLLMVAESACIPIPS